MDNISLQIAIYFTVAYIGMHLGHFAVICSDDWHIKGSGNSLCYPGLAVVRMGTGRNVPVLVPAMELLMGFAAAGFFSIYGNTCMFWLLTSVTWIFMVATISDIRYREIPNELTVMAMAMMVVLAWGGWSTIGDIVAGMLPALAVLLNGILFSLITGRDSIGGGDIKFLFSIGGLMGFGFASIILLVGCLILLFMYGVHLIEDIFKGTRTECPMMAGFASAYFILLFSHYLVPPEFSVLYLL